MKRLLLALFIAGLWTPANASGTIPYSLSQQLDSTGKPLSGCLLYTIQAGTVATPQSSYQDGDLSIALPNPIICDAAGRLPQFFLADGLIKVRLSDKDGNTIVSADGIQVIGPSSGGGGGGSVDATTVFTTGDVKASYRTGALSGWVRMNGRTIGSATSGATERANLDTEALFLYLWSADSNLTVSGGRGVSAAADWAANKTITLPDARGQALAFLDDMGTTAAGNITSTYCGTTLALGVKCGSQTSTIAKANIPSYDLAVDIASGQGSHTHTQTNDAIKQNNSFQYAGAGGGGGPQYNQQATVTINAATLPAMTGLAHSGGSGTAFGTLSPMIMLTGYIKL